MFWHLTCQEPDWLIKVFYAVSAIFRPYNGDMLLNNTYRLCKTFLHNNHVNLYQWYFAVSQECDFLQQNLNIYTFLHFWYFYPKLYVLRMGRKWCSVWRTTTPLARKRPFHWISMKSRLVRSTIGTSKFQNLLHLTNIRRRYMSEILP